MTTLEILKSWLREHGYDGLRWEDKHGSDVCGCCLSYFIPCCDSSSKGCRAAYKHADGLMYLEKEVTQ